MVVIAVNKDDTRAWMLWNVRNNNTRERWSKRAQRRKRSLFKLDTENLVLRLPRGYEGVKYIPTLSPHPKHPLRIAVYGWRAIASNAGSKRFPYVNVDLRFSWTIRSGMRLIHCSKASTVRTLPVSSLFAAINAIPP